MKNEQKLKDYNLKPIYYYDGKVTVCLLLQDGGQVKARGVAICSPEDQFVKATGRALALGRAMQAIERGESGEISSARFWRPDTGYSTYGGIAKAHRLFHSKSIRQPVLTEAEIYLLSKLKKNSNHEQS